MKRFRVRFHLGAGPNHGKWQVKTLAGERYYDPSTYSLTMLDCQLRNYRRVAERIYAGENKAVCAWIDCSEVFVGPPPAFTPGLPVTYNPKVAPYWQNMGGRDIDNLAVEVLQTKGRAVFYTGQMTKMVNGTVTLSVADEAEDHRRMARMKGER